MPKETTKNRSSTISISPTVLLLIVIAIVTTMILVFGYPKSDSHPAVVIDKSTMTPDKPDEIKTIREPSSAAEITTIDFSDWLTYTDDEFGFELSYPSNSTIKERGDVNYRYVRLQNYVTTDDAPGGLRPGEYYLEMFLFNEQAGHNIWQPCSELFLDHVMVSLAGQEIYRGEGMPGGDAGGKRFGLCFDESEKQLYIQATENHTGGVIVNEILDTFKFIE